MQEWGMGEEGGGKGKGERVIIDATSLVSPIYNVLAGPFK